MTAPARRRFRWSLRTMFVLVTLAACWLGWRFGDVSQRQSMRRLIEEKKGYVIVDSDEGDGLAAVIPKWRVALGDKPADFIAVPASWTDADVARTKRLFPEAQVLRMTQEYPARIDRRWRTRP